MASIQEMIAKAAEEVGTTTTTPTDSSAPEATSGGIEIERQNIEHVQGQAKSGDDLAA